MSKVFIRLKEKETGIESDEISIEELIYNQHDIEFRFPDEELAFYTELVKKFNSVCKDYYKLKQALDEIEIKLQNETILVDDEIERLLQIIIKAKGE